MKECLECKKKFEAKRDSAKYCSVNCRVNWNRKNGKKKEVKPFQMQVLYNSMVELNEKMVENIERLALPKIELPTQTYTPQFFQGVISQTKPINIIRSFDQWRQLKLECSSLEEWEELKQQINDSPNLSTKQKDLIINIS